MFRIIVFLSLFLSAARVFSQCLTPVNFQQQASAAANPFPNLHHSMTAQRDTAATKPYLYVAQMEMGLHIYNISSINSPSLVTTIVPSALNNLYVMSLTQAGNYLYLALGNHFNANAQRSGMAIIDISAPASPTVKSVYTFTANSGSGYVAVDGNYAFLAAMQNDILVFDVTSKTSPTLVSQFNPTKNFPVNNPPSGDLLKINARSMKVKNNLMYLCYDAGGVRIINTTNKNALVELGQYSNPVLLNKPRAYNNLILDDTLLYVACDYAGMEVLNVKNPANISQVSWWNPWLAGSASNTWFNSPGHTNEIEYDKNCKLLFMSAGRSDAMAVSVANPLLPDSCAQFGTKVDSNGTWGVGHYQNQIYLTYIVASVPFYSNWSGVKIISYNNNCTTSITEEKDKNTFKIYPNPATGELTIEYELNSSGEIILTDALGKEIKHFAFSALEKYGKIDTGRLAGGIYFIKVKCGDKIYNQKLLLAKD